MCYSKELIEYWSQHLGACFFEEEDLIIYAVAEELESALLSEVVILGYLLPKVIIPTAPESDKDDIIIITSVASNLALMSLRGLNPVTALADTLTGMSVMIPRDQLDRVVSANQHMIGELTALLISIRKNYPLILGGDQ